MKKEDVLTKLIHEMENMVDLMSLDKNCRWIRGFLINIDFAKYILENGMDGEISILSSSIRSVYGGMNSFNDYEPAIYDQKSGRYQVIPGAENFDRSRAAVFDLAVELIATGEVIQQ